MLAPNESTLQSSAQLMNVLADPARLRILNLLRARRELCSCEIGPITGYIPSKISRHLSLLKQAGLLVERREGTFIHYQLVNTSDPLLQRILEMVDLIAVSDPCLQGDRLAIEDQDCCEVLPTKPEDFHVPTHLL